MTTRKNKKKKKTRIFSICLIIIALLLIVGCGLYILKDKLVNTTETSNSPVVSTEVQNQSDGTSSDENAEIKEDLFGLFLDGKIDAESILEEGVEEPINASTLDLEGDEWDSYHFYDYRDVNNDGDADENDEKYFYHSLPNSDDIEKISEAEYNELIDSILQD